MKEKLKLVPKSVWILSVIIIAGIFLRVYEFRDWMVFNPDQARDAMLVHEVLDGKESMILVGPEVGNHRFGLGPWFYHLEIFSAKIFGREPWKLAIPDLIFSILTIPLFYLFIRKYFIARASLILTALASFSYFMVRYSRFAFNPNSIPFFVLLFLLGVLLILESDKKKGFFGAILIGIGIGVGMQLHILLFFIMPAVTGVAFIYLFFKKRPVFPAMAKIILILLFIAVTNIGQILYESEHGGRNTRRFIKSFTKSAEEGGGIDSLGRDILCQSQANFHILTSLGNSEHCDAYKILDKSNPNQPIENSILLIAVASFIFSAGGYVLLFKFWRKEKDEKRKNFLALCGVYGSMSLLAMFPIISQASIRYYIITFFLPFIFLGLWMEYAKEKLKNKPGKAVVASVLILIFAFQFHKIQQVWAAHRTNGASDVDYAIFGEVEIMMEFISQNVDLTKDVYIAGKSQYFSRFYKPFLFFGPEYGVDIQRGDKDKRIKPGYQVIYVQQSESDKKIQKKTFMGRTVKNYKTFENVSIINFGSR